jgi:hypothetical protein
VLDDGKLDDWPNRLCESDHTSPQPTDGGATPQVRAPASSALHKAVSALSRALRRAAAWPLTGDKARKPLNEGVTFPFFTIENVDRVDETHIIVGNDNSLAFSAFVRS